MRKSDSTGKNEQSAAIDEVEELLKLTEDDLLLKLTVNSHISSKSKSKSKSNFDFVPESSHTNAIDPDLDRRFQALRSKKPSKPNPQTEIYEDVDNLFARFAALKAPSTASATCSNSSIEKSGNVVKDESYGVADDDEDEVSNIINWAIDAARLDPSPSSDETDDNYSDSDDETSRTVDRKKKGSKK